MSHNTLSRIPLELRHYFNIYEFLSKKFSFVRNSDANNFLRQTSTFNNVQRNWRKNVTGQEIFNPKDFPPLIAELISPIFQDRAQSDYINDRLTKQETLVSSRNHTLRHFSDYQARMLLSFASTLSPYEELPNVKSALNSFKWYQHLLSKAPVTIFLKQKQRLMSQPSLLSSNAPFENLREGVSNLTSKFNYADAFEIRTNNYYFTDLVSSDLFGLAIASCVTKDAKSGGMNISPTQDKLYEKIVDLQKPKVFNAEGQETGIQSLNQMVRDFPLKLLTEKLLEIDEPRQSLEYFPSDVVYNDIFLLTIGSPVIQFDHSDLLQFIASQTEFEVFSVRISSSFTRFLEQTRDVDCEAANSGGTYDDLLNWAQKHHDGETKKVGPLGLMHTFGQWGLVEVSDSIARDSLYLFK